MQSPVSSPDIMDGRYNHLRMPPSSSTLHSLSATLLLCLLMFIMHVGIVFKWVRLTEIPGYNRISNDNPITLILLNKTSYCLSICCFYGIFQFKLSWRQLDLSAETIKRAILMILLLSTLVEFYLISTFAVGV